MPEINVPQPIHFLIYGCFPFLKYLLLPEGRPRMGRARAAGSPAFTVPEASRENIGQKSLEPGND
jgi:hypothetical protein